MEVQGFIVSLRCSLIWKLGHQLIVYSIHLLLMILPGSVSTFYVKMSVVFVVVVVLQWRKCD